MEMLFNQEYVKIALICIVTFIFLFIVLRKVFKVASNLKIFAISIIVLIIITSLLFVIGYNKNIDYENLGGKYYVQGRIVSISDDKIKIKLIDHNLIEYDSSTIEITVDSKTVYRIQKSNGLEENISYKDLSFGDKINGVSRQGNVKNNTIYVQKILLRD